ncbi:MAG: flagellar hook-associated protein FlgK [Opitutaceae bacterium]
MSLFSAISATTSGLAAETQAINVTGNNIANLNNPDYADEQVDISSLGTVQTSSGAVSMGVSASVSEDRNAVLDSMVRQEDSLTSGFTAQQSLLNEAQASLAENIASNSSSSSTDSTATESGLGAAIDDFFNSVESYASDPSDTGEGQALVQQAGVLTDRFNEIDQNLALVQSNANEIVTNGVSTANTLLGDIATLNSQINSLDTSSPGSALALVDQREGDLEQLAGLVPITATADAQGEMNVTTTDGSGNNISLVTGGTVNNTLAFNGTALTTAGSSPVSLGVSSGSLQGTITASLGPVQDLIGSLNSIAQEIVTAVNGAYNPGGTGNDFFDPAGLTAGTIAVDSSLTPSTLVAGTGAAGDNSLALAVANVANTSFSTANGDAIDGTVDEAYASAVSTIGQALDTANTQVTDQTNVQTIINNERQSVSGVSVDEEMSNLMTYQKAYQASSEVFQVIDDMLTTLIDDISASG